MLEKNLFATAPNGAAVERYTITNDAGASVELLNLGAALHKVRVPDRDGKLANVTLSHEDVGDYLRGATFAGAICGRVANRISGAAFTLDGQTFRLAKNDGENHLHGGPEGFHQRLWDAAPLGGDGVRFSLESPDGEGGYPGCLRVEVTYHWSKDNCLRIDYRAESDRRTPCALTNHAYWSLGGYDGADPLRQEIQIFADRFTPIDEHVLPTGELAPVAGALDLREPRPTADGIGAGDPQLRLVGGYDHNFVLRAGEPGALVPAACLRDKASGRRLLMRTTLPGLQFYSGRTRAQGHTGVALEAQFFPDALRHTHFPSIVLEAGLPWCGCTEYQFDVLSGAF